MNSVALGWSGQLPNHTCPSLLEPNLTEGLAPVQLMEDQLSANPPEGSKVTIVRSLKTHVNAYFMPKEFVSNQAALKVRLCWVLLP